MQPFMHYSVILALLKKDLRSLLPLVLITWTVFLMQPVIAGLEPDANEGLAALQANFYWVAYVLCLLLMISVLQLDPAVSFNHDWLTRPIPRGDWLLGKLLFLLATVTVPIVLSRLLLNLGAGYGFGLSLAYALALENPAGLLPVPLFFAIALLTPNLRRFLQACVVVFLVFLIPAWDLTRPLLNLIGVDMGADFGVLMWMQSLPIALSGMLGVALVYWLLYGLRRERWAWLTLSACVALYFFSIYPPRSVFDWDDAVAVQAALINDGDAMLDEAVMLEQALACFPAAITGAGSGEAADPVLVQAGWVDASREAAMRPGAMTFVTRLRSRHGLVEWVKPSNHHREMAVDWRVDHVRVRGRLAADSLAEDLPLRRSFSAVNVFAPVSPVMSDYWLVPADAVEPLYNDPSTRLILDFDLVLLSPTPYELPTDGERRDFPELGSCKADLDRGANAIEVECIKRGPLPALMSAELVGVEASRVDSDTRVAFKPDWLEALGRKRYELTLARPSLVDSSVILLTAYQVERMVHKQVASKGLLGDSPEVCPLPGSERHAQLARSNWSDKSPHEVNSITVEPGVRVEVLDWRREIKPGAPTLFLLPGLGATVHSYDDIAPKLAEKYNVVGMTRRGTGDSSKPDQGYTIERLSQDVLQVLDTLNIQAPILVGHSLGGEELNYLGAHHPDRFSGLIYLDAAYDRVSGPTSKRPRDLNALLPPAPPIRPSESISYQALSEYSRRTGRPTNIPEGEILASYDLASGNGKHDPLYLDAIMMGLQPPRYEKIAVPALALYAVPGSPDALMEAWYDAGDPEVQAAVNELYRMDRQGRAAQISRFDSEVQDSQVVVLEDADHWIFVSHEQEVLGAIERFVDGL